jgi:hypothetical protein
MVASNTPARFVELAVRQQTVEDRKVTWRSEAVHPDRVYLALFLLPRYLMRRSSTRQARVRLVLFARIEPITSATCLELALRLRLIVSNRYGSRDVRRRQRDSATVAA